RRHIEQRGLGGTVLLHAAVEIEVIATEIGEDRAAKLNAIDTALRQPMRRDFHGAVGHAEIAPLGQLLLQRQRIWRGQPAAADGAVKAVAERTDHAAALASQTQRLRQQLRGAGLAIGAGNTDHTDSAAGVIVETSSDGADLDLQRGDLEYRHGGLVSLDAAFGDHRAGAIGNGLLDKLAAVDGRTRIGEKYVARAHLTAVYGEAAHGQSRRRGGQVRQQIAEDFAGFNTQGSHHHTGPLPATSGTRFATAGLRASSGATFSRRMAPPTTRPNTGAATSPPWYLPRLASSTTTTLTMRGAVAGAKP